MNLYPIDSEVDVYYNPNKPKMAYVQRFIKPIGWLFTLILIIGIILLALSLYFLLDPTIKSRGTFPFAIANESGDRLL